MEKNLKVQGQMQTTTEEFFGIEWGSFPLVEFIVSEHRQIGNKYKKCIDIGSGDGLHSKILQKVGLNVFQLDKYSSSANYKVDFMDCDFDEKFDVVFCSHVIEHQRNVGLFLDKIFDIMTDEGLLIIVAPKHSAEQLVEGHLNCFYTSYFVQHLIYSGFDLRKGKYLSCAGFENAALVPKASNFDISERKESGYCWKSKHQERSFFELTNCKINNESLFFHNCEVINSKDGKFLSVQIPDSYEKKGIEIDVQKFKVQFSI